MLITDNARACGDVRRLGRPCYYVVALREPASHELSHFNYFCAGCKDGKCGEVGRELASYVSSDAAWLRRACPALSFADFAIKAVYELHVC